jgi:hypothetical protein
MGSEKQINKVRDLIINYYNITAEDFFSKSRREPIATARQVFFYYLREKHALSFPAIAIMFYKDHTTALYAYKKIKEDIKKDKKIKNFVDFISNLEEDVVAAPYIEAAEENVTDEDKPILTVENNIFLRKEAKNYSLPIIFNSDYLENIFKNIDNRNKSIFMSRYGFGDNTLKTLDDIGRKEKITRERVRQIVYQTITK